MPPEEMDEVDDYVDDPYTQGGYVSAQSTGFGNLSRRLSTITELTEDSKTGRQPLPISIVNRPPSSTASGSYAGAHASSEFKSWSIYSRNDTSAH